MNDNDKIKTEFQKKYAGYKTFVKEYSVTYLANVNEIDKEFILKLYVLLSTREDVDLCAWQLMTDQQMDQSIYQTIFSEHPFAHISNDDIELYQDIDTELVFISGINANNEVMNSLFEMVMMSDKKLEKRSGSLGHRRYRARLIKILHELWD